MSSRESRGVSPARFLGLEGPVDLQQGAALRIGEAGVGGDGINHGVTGLWPVLLVEDSRLDVERLGGDPQGTGKPVEDVGTGSTQASLDLAQVGVETPAAAASCRTDICAWSRCSRM